MFGTTLSARLTWPAKSERPPGPSPPSPGSAQPRWQGADSVACCPLLHLSCKSPAPHPCEMLKCCSPVADLGSVPDTFTCVILFPIRLHLHGITTQSHTDILHSAFKKNRRVHTLAEQWTNIQYTQGQHRIRTKTSDKSRETPTSTKLRQLDKRRDIHEHAQHCARRKFVAFLVEFRSLANVWRICLLPRVPEYDVEQLTLFGHRH